MKKYSSRTLLIGLLIVSNFVLAFFFIKYFNRYDDLKSFSQHQQKQIRKVQEKYDYRAFPVYDKIFKEKNDVVYTECFYYEYREHPLDAYLLANAYYNLTHKQFVLKHIKLAKEQLDAAM
ncbi:hypothetical protein [Flavobacterium foetidum]|uniref:hypothetical protein n=1 Tax=Flavobacterium foetidum TaxID=2026681 RepID=UPI00107572E8|nr:hypothetical protein [Flavobacterium foetidum]KAF2514850.1 hypothetical protein E0W73_10455 [Flavobacterium foetidum]